MSHTPTKKSVFDRIGSTAGNSSSNSGPTNPSHKSTHGFCNAFIKTGLCPLGDTCKFIHEQPNLDKQPGLIDEFRITKTITRVVDMSSPPIKSTVTVTNEQRPIVVSNTTPSSRTVVESIKPPTDRSDRRLSSTDRKQSHSSSSKPKSSNESSKKKSHSSSKEDRHSSNKKQRSTENDSPVTSASDSEHVHLSQKHKKRSNHSTSSSKHKKRESISPEHIDEETLNDQLMRQTSSHNKSPKRTIVIAKRKKDESIKQTEKDSKSKLFPEIEFLGSKKIKPEKKSLETIHQQAENNKKSTDVKREKKSPSKSSTDQQRRRHSSSTNASSTSNTERSIQVKIEDTKSQSNKSRNSPERYERSDRKDTSQSTPPIVQLSPTPPIPNTSEVSEKSSVDLLTEIEKPTSVQVSSPICVILDDDSSPAPSIDKKDLRRTSLTPVKKTDENSKTSSKQSKRTRDSDKSHTKEKSTENTEVKRKRLNDSNSKKVTTSSRSENRSSSNRSDVRHSTKTSLRDESSSRKYREKFDSKPSRSSDSKDRNSNAPSSRSRSNTTRRDTTVSSSEKKRSTHRQGKEKDLENVTDSEEHFDEPILPKQTALEAYMAMDWSLLSRDKRIPLNSQVTSRIARLDPTNHLVGISDRLLTSEQKEKLNRQEFQSSPLTHFMKQLQTKSISPIIDSCHRRFGSCAKDMIEMRHKWFTRSIEPVQQYEFINKEHYMAFQQAINSLLDKTPTDASNVQVETTTTDVLLS